MIPCSDKFIQAMKSPVKQLYVRLEVYDSNMNFIKEVTKSVTKDDIGSISFDSTRPIRRSFSFSLLNLNNEFDWGDSGNLIWIDKRIKLFLGLKLSDGTIEYIPQGVFILTEPQDSHALDGKKTTIQGQDLMYLLCDKRGKFLNQTTIDVGGNIGDVIKTIAQGAGITQFNFDSISSTVPYTLTYQPNDNRYKAISELAALARCDVYFDVFGFLRLRAIDLNEFSKLPVVWSFKNGDPTEKFYAGNVRKMDSTDMCNFVRVIGGSSQTATVIYDLVVDETNSLWTGSPYSIQKLGQIIYFHNDANPDPLITTNDDAKYRAKYTLMKKLGYTERVTLSCAPIFLFDANDVIDVDDSPATGSYLIQSFSLPINPQLMTIECFKYHQIISDWNFI